MKMALGIAATLLFSPCKKTKSTESENVERKVTAPSKDKSERSAVTQEKPAKTSYADKQCTRFMRSYADFEKNFSSVETWREGTKALFAKKGWNHEGSSDHPSLEQNIILEPRALVRNMFLVYAAHASNPRSPCETSKFIERFSRFDTKMLELTMKPLKPTNFGWPNSKPYNESETKFLECLINEANKIAKCNTLLHEIYLNSSLNPRKRFSQELNKRRK